MTGMAFRAGDNRQAALDRRPPLRGQEKAFEKFFKLPGIAEQEEGGRDFDPVGTWEIRCFFEDFRAGNAEVADVHVIRAAVPVDGRVCLGCQNEIPHEIRAAPQADAFPESQMSQKFLPGEFWLNTAHVVNRRRVSARIKRKAIPLCRLGCFARSRTEGPGVFCG